MNLNTLKDTLQSSNINFLIGSGLSRNYLITLGNIESLLEEIRKSDCDEMEKKIIRASLFKKYFEEVMYKNLEEYKKSPQEEADFETTLGNYTDFLIWVNKILLYRYMAIHNKQINIFTTNIDLFFERAFERTSVESNDGFKGRIKPVFDLSNFQKSYRKTSLHYKNISEIPVFNLLKIHGSINWKRNGNSVGLSDFKDLSEIKKTLIDLGSLLDITNDSTIEELIEKAREIKDGINGEKLNSFLEIYKNLLIVNPTKEKFETTLLNTYYYELLRIFANEMEKENTLLFVMGFSFADEHIREIIIRALNSNPTALLYVFAYDTKAKENIENNLEVKENRFINSNIRIIDPETFNELNKDFDGFKNVESFDFKSINTSVFETIAHMIR